MCFVYQNDIPKMIQFPVLVRGWLKVFAEYTLYFLGWPIALRDANGTPIYGYVNNCTHAKYRGSSFTSICGHAVLATRYSPEKYSHQLFKMFVCELWAGGYVAPIYICIFCEVDRWRWSGFDAGSRMVIYRWFFVQLVVGWFVAYDGSLAVKRLQEIGWIRV